MFDLMKELSKVDLQQIQGMSKKLPEDFADTKMPADIPEEAKFKFKISSEAVDRDGEVVKASGADFKWYRKNPIVLLNHWYTVENIIGKCTKVWQEGTDTYAEGYFSQTNPKAKLVQDLYNEKMVNVVSIWFIVKERDPNDRNIITAWEMLEFSVCAVQSNRDAERTPDQKELYQKWVDAGLIPLEGKDLAPEKKEVEMSIEAKLKEAVKDEIVSGNCYVCDIYEKDFVFCVWANDDCKYYRRDYSLKNGVAELSWENREVTPTTQWIEKSLTAKFALSDLIVSMQEVKEGFSDMKDHIEKIADDKATKEKRAIEDAKKLKPDLQKAVSGLSALLEKQKKL